MTRLIALALVFTILCLVSIQGHDSKSKSDEHSNHKRHHHRKHFKFPFQKLLSCEDSSSSSSHSSGSSSESKGSNEGVERREGFESEELREGPRPIHGKFFEELKPDHKGGLHPQMVMYSVPVKKSSEEDSSKSSRDSESNSEEDSSPSNESLSSISELVGEIKEVEADLGDDKKEIKEEIKEMEEEMRDIVPLSEVSPKEELPEITIIEVSEGKERNGAKNPFEEALKVVKDVFKKDFGEFGPKSGECKNEREDCEVKKDLCKDEAFGLIMERRCAETCGMCGGKKEERGECRDRSSICFLGKPFCGTFLGNMFGSSCPHTCGHCSQPPKDDEEPIYGLDSESNKKESSESIEGDASTEKKDGLDEALPSIIDKSEDRDKRDNF